MKELKSKIIIEKINKKNSFCNLCKKQKEYVLVKVGDTRICGDCAKTIDK